MALANQNLLVRFLQDQFGVNASNELIDFILKTKLNQKAQISAWLDAEIAKRNSQKLNLDAEKALKLTKLDSDITKLTNLKSNL